MTRLRPLFLLVVALALGMFADEIGGRQRVEAAFPGDNGRILYTEFGITSPLKAMDPDGQNIRSLYDLGAQQAEVSPDGTKIAFGCSQSAGTPPGHVCIMNSDGSNLTVVTGGGTPTWSPDGTEIAYFEVVPGSGVFVRIRNLETGDTRSFMPDKFQGGFFLAWSPASDEVAYPKAVGGDSGYEIWGLNATTGNTRKIADKASTGDWSPDGTQIVVSDGTGASDEAYKVRIINANSGAQARELGTGWLPQWSPDGNKIAYSIPSQTQGVSSSIAVIDAMGGNPQQIVPVGLVYDWGPPGPPEPKVEFTQAIQVLQSMEDLQADLDDDGAPPVPIVAGKPAAMRVYFDEVDTATTRKVELSGVAQRSVNVALSPGCDVEQQRKQENNCQSADLYFTPPEGEWTATLTIKDAGTDQVVSEHEFTVKSVEADEVLLKAVKVCYTQSQNGSWTDCGVAARLKQIVSLLKRIAPTKSVKVVTSGQRVTADASVVPPANFVDWWVNVALQLHLKYNAADAVMPNRETYYYGMVQPSLPDPSGTLGIASDLPSRGAVSLMTALDGGSDVTEDTVAHETFHMMGRTHTDELEPSANCSKAEDPMNDWPYSNNKIQSGAGPMGTIEVGFDVAAKDAKNGDDFLDIMSYCVPVWISPHTYTKLLTGGGGPLRTSAGANSTPSAGDFWVVSGVFADDGVELMPLFEMPAEANSGAGSGSHRIEVRDTEGMAIFTRNFTPATAAPRVTGDGAGFDGVPIFGEFIPVQPNAGSIAVLDGDDQELAVVVLGGEAPSIAITAPSPGQTVDDEVQVSWTVDDVDGDEHTAWVEYSPDNGATWLTQGMGIEVTELGLTFEDVPGSDNALVRVMVSDGVNTGTAISEPFSVAKKLPEAEILFPESGQEFDPGDLVWLQGLAFDADDLELDDASIEWSSSRDGVLGTGDDLPVYDLSEGVHTITLTVRDSDDNEAMDSITVVVGEGGLKGDVDCDGDVDAVDAQKTLQHVAGLPAVQEPGCPPIGSGGPPFGDVDCDDDVDAVDALSVLRHVAALPVNLPPGCPEIGARRRLASGRRRGQAKSLTPEGCARGG